jgi:anti-sigma B factor antagonist
MAASQFDATVRREHAVAVIDLEGEINSTADSALEAAYTQAAAGDPAAILLNFESVVYINSTGIALIVGLLARARKEHLTVTAYGLTEHYREIFQITRLSDFMGIFPDEASAVGSVPATAG